MSFGLWLCKTTYGKKTTLCYMDNDSFIVYIKTDVIFKDIAKDVETRFGTSNYELEYNSDERPLPKGKIALMKYKLGSKNVKIIVT